MFHTSLSFSFCVSCPCCLIPPSLHFPPTVMRPQSLIMLLSLLIAFGHHPCPAVFSLFLCVTQRDGNSSMSYPTTKQQQTQDQQAFTLCSEQIYCEKRKRISLCAEKELGFRGGPACEKFTDLRFTV